MSEPDFAYQAFRKARDSSEVSTVIAYSAPSDGPLRAVLWHASRQQWIYAPAIAADMLFDDMEATTSMEVDRAAAERLAHDHLHTDLPSIEKLQAMSLEGARMGWQYGPPDQKS